MQNRRSQLADMLSRAEGQQRQVHYHTLNYFSSKDNLHKKRYRKKVFSVDFNFLFSCVFLLNFLERLNSIAFFKTMAKGASCNTTFGHNNGGCSYINFFFFILNNVTGFVSCESNVIKSMLSFTLGK